MISVKNLFAVAANEQLIDDPLAVGAIMMETSNSLKKTLTRRGFLINSTVAGAAAFVPNLGISSNAHAGGTDTIRLGLVGCGGRGPGAVGQCLRAGPNIRLVAMGDVFRDKLERSLNALRNDEGIRNSVDVPPSRQFVGLDAYQQVLHNCDLVILATPAGFRPIHIRAAVAAGKHVFAEKPVAVDGPGVRTVLAAHEEANRQRLSVVVGFQRRYQTSYLESLRRIHSGDLGTIAFARCYWNMGGFWHCNRTDKMSDLEWQLRNWPYFTWLSGDQPCEQLSHNLDVINWALQGHPLEASGMGGRRFRVAPEFGHVFDHFTIQYEYPNNVHVLAMCRQITGYPANISEAVIGTRGAWTSAPYAAITGEHAWRFPRGQDNDPYQQEHVALLRSIREGRPINDLKNAAETTLTAIIGRMAAYTGRSVTWDQGLNSEESLMPERLSWDMHLPVPPVAVPGQAPLR